VRVRKQSGPAPFTFVLPKDINQAVINDPLYDQKGNVVYYNTQYTPNECSWRGGRFNRRMPLATRAFRPRSKPARPASRFFSV
jgi:hypothetical protein